MKRAPVDDVDRRLEAAGLRLQAFCNECAALEGEARHAKLHEIITLTYDIALLRVERDQIIRNTFCR